jgi:cyclin-dependent kinase inhibitor 3
METQVAAPLPTKECFVQRTTPNSYKIVDILYMNNNFGRLAISQTPGRFNLYLDLLTMKENKIDIIICLLTWTEMKSLNIINYPNLAQEAGFTFYHLPIVDGCAPRKEEADLLIPSIMNNLCLGKNVLIHCKLGLGRAGTIASCCINNLGVSTEDAIEYVKLKRPGSIKTSKQLQFLKKYCK